MIIGVERVLKGTLFHFRSTWMIPSDLIRIWNAIGSVERWPEWWSTMERVHVLRGPTLPVAVGSAAEYQVHSPLWYHLTFRSEVTAFDLGKWITSSIEGQLAGSGRWDFSHQRGVTAATLLWDVTVTRPVLARIAAVGPIRSAMSWAHDRVMESGEVGLRRLVQQAPVTA
jgi:hypothetical protein